MREVQNGIKAGTCVITQAAIEAHSDYLQTMIPRVQQVMRQTRERLFQGNTRSPGKLVSLFEPHTEIIRKGKASKPTEFGKMVKIQEAEQQIVTHYEVYDERPSDTDLLVPAIRCSECARYRLPSGAPVRPRGGTGFTARRSSAGRREHSRRKANMVAAVASRWCTACSSSASPCGMRSSMANSSAPSAEVRSALMPRDSLIPAQHAGLQLHHLAEEEAPQSGRLAGQRCQRQQVHAGRGRSCADADRPIACAVFRTTP